MIDTSIVSVGGRLDPESRHLIFEAVVEAGNGSALATGLNRLVTRRSEFGPMISPDVPAGLALNLPLGNLVTQVLGVPGDTSSKSAPLEMGVQLVGSQLGKLSLIGALRGDQVVELNKAIPRWIIKLDQLDKFVSISESFDAYEGVVFHSMIPREMPHTITHLVGSEIEILIGQDAEITWVGIGPPEKLLDQMKHAIDSVGKLSDVQSIAACPSRGFRRNSFPSCFRPELLSSNLDPEESRSVFAKGQDGFSLALEPIANGIKLRIEMEEGFVRLIGTDWVKRIDNANR